MSVLVPLFLSLAATSTAQAFEASSSDLKDGAVSNTFVFKGFGCEGDNVSPAISWSGAPEGTKSFAIMVHDPDAPTGGAGWWHWVVYNLPADTTSLAQGAGSGGGGMPAGAVQGTTDFGAPGWGGPCPPAGDDAHTYVFTVYALGVPALQLPENPTASLVGFMVNANTLDKASFKASYGR